MIRPTHCLVLLLVPALLPIAAFAPGASQAGEPSPAYQASLRRTRELRKQRHGLRLRRRSA